MGSVGNDASFAAVAALLRERVPGVRIVAVGRDVGVPGSAPAGAVPQGAVSKGAVFDETAPLTSGVSRRLRAAGRHGVPAQLVGKAADLVHLVRLAGDLDAVVVPGTGVLERARQRAPGGVLVWLVLVSLACRLRGTTTAWFAVGGSTYAHRVPAWTAVLAALGTRYRSYRNAETRDALPWPGLHADPVAHDAVLSRPEAVDPPARPATHAAQDPRPATDGPRRVAVAVIDHDAGPGPRGRLLRERYERRTAALVRALLRAGAEVELLAADAADRSPVASVLAAVAAGDPDDPADPGVATPVAVHDETGGFDALLERVAAADVVVASRFHLLVAAGLARRPVVALSHADKDAALMRRLGAAEYVVPIDDVDVDRVLALVRAAHADADRLTRQLDAACREAHATVHAEADRLVQALGLGAGRSPAPDLARTTVGSTP